MAITPSLRIPFELTDGIITFDLKITTGSKLNIYVDVTENGVAKDITGTAWTLKYQNEAKTWLETLAGSLADAGNGVVLFAVDGDITAVGNHVAEINEDDDVYQLKGRLNVLNKMASGVIPAPTVTLDWTDFPAYVNTATDGPYTAGTGIAFGTADGDGKVPIAFDGDASDITFDNTTSELTATDVQAAIDELDGIVDQLSGTITIRVRNETGVQIDKGAVVYINGATGNRATVALADADVANTATKTIGLAFANIPHNTDGEIVVLGEITGVDTGDFEDGDQVWLSQTPGQPTNIRPTDDAAYAYRVGYVEVAANNGKILVAPQFEGTVYGETFFAATSVAGVRTELDVPSNGELTSTLSLKQDILAEGAFQDGDKTKLDGIEAGAQVNTVDSVAGKTGTVTLDKNDVGLGNVDNTADADKPISTATQEALDDKADALGPDENYVTDAEKFLLSNTSGTNTGDQDLSGKQDILSEGAFVDGDKTKLDGIGEATESANGLVEWATEAEVLGVADVNAVVRAKHLRVKVETGNGNAISIGDLGGDARGSGSITIQSSRSNTYQVASYLDSLAIGNNTVALGDYAIALGYGANANDFNATAVGSNAFAGGLATALGYNANASGFNSTAVGYNVSAVGDYSTASGYNANASENRSIAVGSGATASGYESVAVGNNSIASGLTSTALGNYAYAFGDRSTASGNYSLASGNESVAVGSGAYVTQTAGGAFGYTTHVYTANVQELGYWSDVLTRAGAVRVHGTGMVAMTIQNRATAYGDGGATAGSEADNTVIREGFAIRRNGDEILIDVNIGGTVKTLSLGTAA